MIKKILSLLLLPLFVVTLFVGCDKDRSVDEIKEYYQLMKDKHITEVSESVYTSTLFNQINGSDFADNITLIYENELGQRLNDGSTRKLPKTIAVPSDMGIYCEDEELYYRYYALIYIQQPILNAMYNYYTNWSENFYNGLKLVNTKDLDSEDLNNVYNKLVELDEELAEFATAKQKFQDDVDVLGFENVNRAVVTTYSYKVNRLIEKVYGFVDAFRDVHIKYIWNDSEYNSKEGVGTIDSLNRYVDEANLDLAYALFNYVKGFEAAECDLSKFIYDGEVNTRTAEIKITDLYFGDLLNQWLDLDNFKLSYLEVDSADKITEGMSEIEQNTIAKFVYAQKVFKQKLGVFEQIYPEVNFNKYIRILYNIDSTNSSDTIASYEKQLTLVEKANLNLILNFFNETCENYLNQLFNITDTANIEILVVKPAQIEE